MGGETIRVLLADDHPVVRDGIRHLLEAAPGVAVTGEAADGGEALRLARELRPDVLLLDMEMPGLSGVEVARQLRDGGLPVRVLALSAYDDPQYIFGVLESGAAGYLLKDEAAESILAAVRGVARGEEGWLSRRVTETLMRRARQDGSEPQLLTRRELEVLRWVAEGLTAAGIARELGITRRTAVFHMENVLRKLGVSNRTQAVVEAIRRGWLRL